MSKKTSDIIKSIHSKSKPISSIIPKSEQPIIVGGASKLQTKAFDKIACAVADIAAGTGGVPLTRSITGVMSVQGGGDLTADRTVSLVNDEVNPDPNKYYGTDAMGVKGYHSTSILGGTDLSISNRNDTTLNINSSTGVDVVVPEATQILAGLMTAPDKTKLDGIAPGAEVNVQADWNEADPASDAYILNKPVIPTDTGIIYSLSDGTPIAATIGDRGMASAGAGADKTYETSQTIDPLTGDTINQNFANGTVNFDNTIINNTDSTINNTNTVTNNDEDSDINNNGNTINNIDSTINNEGSTINNYPGLNLIQCNNILVGMIPTPTIFSVPALTDMVRFTLTDITEYGPDDQANPGCLPPYEMGHIETNNTQYNLTIGNSANCEWRYIQGCGYMGSDPKGIVSISWNNITNEIIVAGQLIDGATQLPMYSIDVCFYQFTDDVTTINNIETTTNHFGDNIVNLDEDSTITNNFNGDVNNNYGDTYTENNVYEEGATINNTGEVTNNYNNYTENNEYTDSQINNTYTNTETNNYGGTTNNYNTEVTYDENSEVTYEGDVIFEGDMYLGGNIINTFNESNNATTVVEVGPGVSWTDISNALTCDGSDAISTPIDPTLLDNVSLVIADAIVGNTKSNAITSGSPATYGGASDLRGNTLTPAEVNAADFGAVFKFGDSAWIKVTGFNFVIPVTDTILGVKVNVIFTSTVDTVNVDCITMTIYHTDNSEFTSGVMVQEAGVDVAQATTLNFQTGANVTDMGGGVVRVDITGGGGGTGLVNIGSANDSLVYAGVPTWVLTGALPITADLIHLTTDSGTNLILGIDYTVDIVTGTITWLIAPGLGETVYARWVTGNRTPGTVPGGQAYYEEYVATGGETDIVLSNTPAGANWIRVSTESSLYGKQGATRDWTYNAGTNTITMNYALQAGDVVSVQYIGFVAMPDQGYVTPILDNTGTVTAASNDYIVVTYIGGDTTIQLPDATTCNGAQIMVKKFTGEDVLTTTILPYGTQLIDGYTGATMNINRTMYTFTAVNGNWYLGD